MPLYQCSLSQYLAQCPDLSYNNRLSILFQTISSVHHLVLNNTVHRDIKCDNILVTEEEGCERGESSGVQCVLTDFGMAHNSLTVTEHPYGRKWGNPLLMPPEVANARPGSQLDYSKADIWCVGAICYQLFGAANPFRSISSKSYTSLPELPTPSAVQYLVSNMLAIDTALRWSSEQCLAYCGVLLWLPHLLLGGNHGNSGVLLGGNHGNSPSLDVIAEALSVLSYRTLACKADTVDITSRLYYCNKVSTELIKSVLS